MNIVIAGAGQVGRHAAEVLVADRHDVTVIDRDAAALKALGDLLDVRTLRGHAAAASTLREAGVAGCDLIIAATDSDETNLLCATVAKGIGAGKSIARVHHSSFYDRRHYDYAEQLNIDRLVCPELITAVQIAGCLRSPGAMAVEHFARERIEMQQLAVTDGAPAVGVPLAKLALPKGTRLATVDRGDTSFIPDGQTVLAPGDVITLIGETRAFAKVSQMFQFGSVKRQAVVIVGGSPIGVWLARALRSHRFSVRLFERNRARAEELADKLPHITVIQDDPTDPSVFAEEKLHSVDAFVAVTNDDEDNLLAVMLARSQSQAMTIAVLQSANYLSILERIGVDRAYSPQVLASKEILRLASAGPIQSLATLACSTVDIYEIRPTPTAAALGIPLAKLKLPENTTIAAVQHNSDVRVPGAADTIKPGDTIIVIAPHGAESQLRKTFLK